MGDIKPTIYMIPGGWHCPAHYEPVLGILRSHGYPVAAINLPTVGTDMASKTIYDDIKTISSELTQLADDGRDIIIMMHSYGGFVGSDAAHGLGKTEREKEGKKGGIIKMIYMATVVVAKGGKPTDAFDGDLPPYITVNDKGMHSPIDPHNVFYNDLSSEDSSKWISMLQPMPLAIFYDANEHDPPTGIPFVNIICKDDHALPYETQKSATSLLENCQTFELDSSHSPFLSMPERIAEIVIEVAR